MKEELYHHVKNRNTKAIRTLLAEGANPTEITRSGRTFIGEAAFRGYADVLKILLDSCTDDFTRLKEKSSKKRQTSQETDTTPDGMDGLQWDDEILSTSSHTANDEWSKLFTYYAQMFEQTGEFLVNTKQTKDPHKVDDFNQTPIHYASLFGYTDCLNILLQNGSPIDPTTYNGITPLHFANKKEIVEILLKYKANPNAKTYLNGESPLHVAVQTGDFEIVELLLKAGTDINATNFREQTPLMLACSESNLEIIYLLIDSDAKLNIQDQEGATALYYAVRANNVLAASYLIKHGARTITTYYLLHYCAQNNYVEMAKVLIAEGHGNVFIRDFTGSTPLLFAIENCAIEMVELLLQYKSKTSEGDDYFVKGLHVAVKSFENVDKFEKIAFILLNNGVSINNYNSWNETPLFLAIKLKKYKIAEFLIKEGADVNREKKNCSTDNFFLARKASNLNLLIVLVNAGLKMYPIPSDLEFASERRIYTLVDTWLISYYKQPPALQLLCRIFIRKCLIKNLDTVLARPKSFRKSPMEHLISQIELPKFLQLFLYEFNVLSLTN